MLFGAFIIGLQFQRILVGTFKMLNNLGREQRISNALKSTKDTFKSTKIYSNIKRKKKIWHFVRTKGS